MITIALHATGSSREASPFEFLAEPPLLRISGVIGAVVKRVSCVPKF